MRQTVTRGGTIAIAVLLGVSLLAGAGVAQQATSQEATLTINADGTIETFDAAIVVTNDTYQQMRSNTPDQHDTVAAALAEDIVADESGIGSYSHADDVQTAAGYRIEITFSDIDGIEGFTTETTGDSVHVAVDNPDQIISSDYLETNSFRVEMPGPITNTTADEVTEMTATWNLHETTPSSITATAALESDDSSGSNETDWSSRLGRLEW
ncbi:MAG: hypothetical protein U5K37_06490 [Natrialbaceae archaeon]|nr:hypothetical protein [Natrialbaceae archaeon]